LETPDSCQVTSFFLTIQDLDLRANSIEANLWRGIEVVKSSGRYTQV
jgi:hypothetical protein